MFFSIASRNKKYADSRFCVLGLFQIEIESPSLSGGLAAHGMGNGQNSGAKNFNEFSTTDSFNLFCQSPPCICIEGEFSIEPFLLMAEVFNATNNQ